MTPEAEAYLEKAREDLRDARKIADIPIAKVAARSAYYAAFHAAEAFIFERTGVVAKTHSGLRSEFARLLKQSSEVERALLTFLSKAYKYKEISDYGVGRLASISDHDARTAIEEAARFVDHISALLLSAPR